MKYLSSLSVGKKGVVKSITAKDGMHRRFMDIGLINGTVVECVGESPFGDPKAYLIRGAVIAIRSDDAEKILLRED